MPAKDLIKHVVIIVKENHTFDNYFGTFPGANGDASLAPASDPPAHGDPPHNHAAWLKRATSAVRQQYSEKDIPDYFSYARQFTLCDNYFTEIASQSIPNHLMLIAAASPLMDNPHKGDPPELKPPFKLKSLPDSLEQARLDWRVYGGDFIFQNIAGLTGRGKNHGSDQFAIDAAKGNLPAVTWLYSEAMSEHPPFAGKLNPVVGPGMRWTVQQVDAIVAGGLWKNSVVFITWDDWGGWFDHVEPKHRDDWLANGFPPSYRNTQFSYGPRVGCLVLSPFARSGHISKAFHSHVSLVKFCETTFGLPPLNDRDTQSDDMSDCFDFTRKPADPPHATAGPAVVPKPAKPPGSGKPLRAKAKAKSKPKPKPKKKPSSTKKKKTVQRTPSRKKAPAKRARRASARGR